MARGAKKGTSGEAAEAPAHEAPAHEYLIRRRIEGVPSHAADIAWLELGSVSALSPRRALLQYGQDHAEELAALMGAVVLEAVSVRYRLERRASPRRQLAIEWGDVNERAGS